MQQPAMDDVTSYGGGGHDPSGASSPTPTVIFEGPILRKKRRGEWVVLAVKRDEDQVATSVHCHQDEQALAFCYLGAIVWVKCSRCARDGEERLIVSNIDLVQCAPIPEAVHHVLQGILDDRFPVWTLPISKLEAQQISILEFREKRSAVAGLIRQLKGCGETERDPRQRMPHTKRRHLELLDSVERRGMMDCADAWRLRTIQPRILATSKATKHDMDTMTLNFPAEDVELRRRQDYLLSKKQPQVEWMVQRVCELEMEPTHILDVGGGRGDLSIALSLRLQAKVTVIDKNESSLRAAAENANKLGCGARMKFVHSDFYSFVQGYRIQSDNSNPEINLVVALHACGDLSDVAMVFAERLGCPFVVCPCCYTKRYITKFVPPWHAILRDEEERTIIGRLAELNERPHVSKRAMCIINSIRLYCIGIEQAHEGDASARKWQLCLEEYQSKSSKRNLVLVRDLVHR